jgi:hypothetical protein
MSYRAWHGHAADGSVMTAAAHQQPRLQGPTDDVRRNENFMPLSSLAMGLSNQLVMHTVVPPWFILGP